jgi:hypothetical protein
MANRWILYKGHMVIANLITVLDKVLIAELI